MRRPTRSDGRSIRDLLDRLPAVHTLLHSVTAPASAKVVDHLVVGPCGIFAIDVVRGTGTIKERNDTLWLGGSDLRGECIAAHRKAAEIGRLLHHAITPVLCFADARLPAPVIHFRHVVVCSPDILAQFIVGAPRCLDTMTVQLLADRSSALAHRAQRAGAGTAPQPLRRPGVRPATSPSAAPPVSRTKAFGRRTLATAAATVVCIIGAWAVPALAHFSELGVDQSVKATSRSQSGTDPLGASNEAVPAASSPTDVADAGGAPSTELAIPSTLPVTGPALLPRLDFACPQQGSGWTATPVATEFQQDPVGYHLWYQTSGGGWQYWGQFKSGSEAPAALPGLLPGEAVDVRMDRSFHMNAEGAPTMLTFTAPDAPC
jgi:hypothetical protein